MILCVVGPTGVGKSKLSIMLAKKYDAIVVNADSMQVYKNLDIGTAKITDKEKEGIPHYLFDIKDVDEMYTIYDYQHDLRNLLDSNKNKNIIIVGGSGLYIKAGLFNYVFNEKDNNTYEEYSNDELYNLVIKKYSNIDIHKNNRKRMISLLNRNEDVLDNNNLLYDVKFIGLTTNREVLYDRINKRVDVMIKSGLINEVKSLYDRKIVSKSIMTGIGYKELYLYFDGLISLDDAINLIKQRSRKYAKRQYTWFNNQMCVKWFNVDFNNFDNTFNEVIYFVDNN